jgi:hypothetical protein
LTAVTITALVFYVTPALIVLALAHIVICRRHRQIADSVERACLVWPLEVDIDGCDSSA